MAIAGISTFTTISWLFSEIRWLSLATGLDRGDIVPGAMLRGLESPTLHRSHLVARAVGSHGYVGSLLSERFKIGQSGPFSGEVEVVLLIVI